MYRPSVRRAGSAASHVSRDLIPTEPSPVTRNAMTHDSPRKTRFAIPPGVPAFTRCGAVVVYGHGQQRPAIDADEQRIATMPIAALRSARSTNRQAFPRKVSIGNLAIASGWCLRRRAVRRPRTGLRRLEPVSRSPSPKWLSRPCAKAQGRSPRLVRFPPSLVREAGDRMIAGLSSLWDPDWPRAGLQKLSAKDCGDNGLVARHRHPCRPRGSMVRKLGERHAGRLMECLDVLASGAFLLVFWPRSR